MTGAYGGPNLVEALNVLEQEEEACQCGRVYPDHQDTCPAREVLEELIATNTVTETEQS